MSQASRPAILFLLIFGKRLRALFLRASLQARNIARIGTSHSLILIGKARVNADPIVSAIILANEFSELLEAKATVKRH